ncbi:MAG: hypothetical protein GEU75_14070 [Dehalococcoidia bacterium]|nr:hypothetical protein [Dehalococcoidia bacterium]
MFSRPWKLLPLGAIVALMALVLVPGGSLSPNLARADVESVECDDNGFDSGDELACTVTLTAESGDIAIDIGEPGDATNIELNLEGCNEDCDDADDDEDAIEVQESDITEIDFTITADCEEETDIDIDVSQASGGSDSVNVTCGDGGSADGNVIISKDADGEDGEFDFDISGSSTECDDDFTLEDGGEEGFTCDTPGDYVVTETLPSGWAVDSIDCDTSGDAEVAIDEDEGSVEIELNEADDTVECTFTNELTDDGGQGGNASTVTISAGPNSVNCSGSSFITIVVKDAQGNNVADGTAVSVSTNLGSVNPGNATTQGGGVLILYTGPSNQGGSATITASAGGITNTTSVAVECSQEPAPTNPPPPPAGGSGIQPPNTGDAGLADNGSSFGYAGLAFIASVLLGTIAFARVRA